MFDQCGFSQALAQHITQRLAVTAGAAATHGQATSSTAEEISGVEALQSWEMQQSAPAAHAAVDMAALMADVAAVAAEVIGQPVDPDRPLMEASSDSHHILEHVHDHAVVMTD